MGRGEAPLRGDFPVASAAAAAESFWAREAWTSGCTGFSAPVDAPSCSPPPRPHHAQQAALETKAPCRRQPVPHDDCTE